MLPMKRIFISISLLFAGFLAAQGVLVQPFTQADITGTGATVQLVTAGGGARGIIITALSTNSGIARCGDSNVAVARGTPLAAGISLSYGAITSMAVDPQQPLYNLAAFYCYIANSDKVAVQWTR